MNGEEYDNSYAPCACCGEGCDPMAATPTQWQCNDCEQWNDKEQTMQMDNNVEAMRVQAAAMLDEYDVAKARATSIRVALDKLCADYGVATGRWGFRPEHMRIELYHAQERKVS